MQGQLAPAREALATERAEMDRERVAARAEMDRELVAAREAQAAQVRDQVEREVSARVSPPTTPHAWIEQLAALVRHRKDEGVRMPALYKDLLQQYNVNHINTATRMEV